MILAPSFEYFGHRCFVNLWKPSLGAYKGLRRNNVELYAYYKKSIYIVELCCVQVSEVELRVTLRP